MGKMVKIRLGVGIKNQNKRSGLTLLESLITITIIGVVGTIAGGTFGNFNRNFELESAAKILVSDIKAAQVNAVAGVDANADGESDSWGVCFRNPAGDGNDFYEVVAPPSNASGSTCAIGQTSGNVVKTVYLPAGVNFLDDPASGTAKIVIFNKISGSTTAGTEVNIVLSSATGQKVATVEPSGQTGTTDVAVNSITPSSASNTGSLSITEIRGAGFKTGATVKLTRTGQSDINCSGVSFSSSALLTGGSCVLNAAPTHPALAGLWNVVVTNPDSKFGILTNGFTVTAPAPSVSSINPSTVTNGGAAAITSVGGSNFQTGATVVLTKTGQPNIGCTGFTFTNPSTLSNGSCNMSGAATGTWNVVVTNTGGDGASSLPAALLTVNNDTPTVSSISPTTKQVDDPDFTLTVTGTKFVSNSVIKWCDNAGSNCVDKTTTFVNVTTLTATITTADLTVGNHQVKVSNPAPGGGTSTCDGTSACTLTVAGPQPLAITSISPTSANNNAAVSMTVNGTGFNTTDAAFKLVKTGEADIVCSVSSRTSTQLQGSCNITNAATGSWDVWVTNPTANPPATVKCSEVTPTPCAFTVTAGTISVGGITPNKIISHAWNQPFLAIRGANFTSAAKVRLTNGTTTFWCTDTGLEGGASTFTFISATLLVNGTCNFGSAPATGINWDVIVKIDATDYICDDCLEVVTASLNTTARFWVPDSLGNESANWSTTNLLNWAETPGGVGGATVPDSTMDVYFTSHSFSANGATVTVWNAASAKSISFIGLDQNINFSGTQTLTAAGSISFESRTASAVTYSGFTGSITMNSALAGQILDLTGDGATRNIWSTVTFNNSTGVWSLITPHNADTSDITLTDGTLNTNNNAITAGTVSMAGGTLNLGASSVTVKDGGTSWNVTGGTVNGTSSTITTSTGSNVTFAGGGKTYNNVTFNNAGTSAITGTNNVFNDLDFNNTGAVTISGGMTVRNATFDNTNNNVTINGANTFNGTLDANNGTGTVTFDTNANRFNSTVTFDNTGLTTISNSKTFVAAVTSAGAMSIGNSNTFSSTLAVSGAGSSSVGNTNTFTGNASFAGTTTAGGDVNDASCSPSTTKNTFSGTLSVTGSSSNLVIDGSCNVFTGAVTIGGVLTMNANKVGSSFGAGLTVSGTGASSITARNTFTGAASFGGNVTISGITNSFQNTFATTGTGNLTVNAGLTGNVFTGASTVAGAASLASNNTFNNSLTIGGTASFTASNKVVGATQIAGNTTISGNSNDFDSSFQITAGTLTINSGLTGNNFDGAVTISGAASINSNNTFNSTVNVGGTLTMASSNHFDGTATIACGVSTANVCVTGAGTSSMVDLNTFAAGVRINSSASTTLLTIGADNTFNGALTVLGTGTSTIAGTALADNWFKGAVSFGGNLDITGSGNDFDGTLTTTGSGNLTISSGQTANVFTGAVTVGGTAALNSNNTFSSTLAVNSTGISTAGNSNSFANTVTVSGPFQIGNSNTFSNTVAIGGAAVSGATTIGTGNQFNNTGASSLVIQGATAAAINASNGSANTFAGTVTVSTPDPTIGGPNVWNATTGKLILNGSGTALITGTNTGANAFKDLSRLGTNVVSDGMTFSGDAAVAGALTLTGFNGASRLFVRSDAAGTQRTITVNGTNSLTDVDFKDIVGAGTAAWSGTRIGDAKNNSGITFTASRNVFWVGNGGSWYANAAARWSDASGGIAAVTNYPLPQDTAKFDAASFSAISQTVTIDASRLPSIDFTGQDDGPTIAFNTAATIYGKLAGDNTGKITFISGMTVSGTGALTLENRGVNIDVNSGGKTFTMPITINAPSGTVTLLTNNFSNDGQTITLTAGTLTANNINVNTSKLTSSSGATLALGSGTWTVSGTGTATFAGGACTGGTAPWNVNTGTTVTSLSGASAQIIMSGSGAKDFCGGAKTTYQDLVVNGTGATTIDAGNTFNNFDTATTIGALTISGGETFAGTFRYRGSNANATVNGANNFRGTVTFANGTGTVTIAETGNRFNLDAGGNPTGSNTSFNNTGATTVSGGDNRFGGAVNSAGAFTLNGNTNIFSSSFAAVGAISISGSSNSFNGTATVSCPTTPSTTPSFCGESLLTISSGQTNNFIKGAVSIVGNSSLASNNTFGDSGSTISNFYTNGTLTMTSGNIFRGISNNLCTSSANVCAAGAGLSSITDSNTFAAAVKFSDAGAASRATIGSSNTFSSTLTVAGTSSTQSTIGNSNTFSDDVIFAAALQIGGGSASPANCTGATKNSFADVLTLNTGAFTINGSCNTFTGAVTVSAGAFIMNDGMDRNSFSSSVTVSAAGSAGSKISENNTFTGAFSLTSTSGGLTVSRVGGSGGNAFSSSFSYTTSTGVLTTNNSNNNVSGSFTLSASGGASFTINGANTFQDFTITGTGALAASSFTGANTFRDFLYGGSGTANITFSSGTGNTFCSFRMTTAPKTATFQSGSTQTLTATGCTGGDSSIVGTLSASGSGVNLMTIQSSTALNQFNISSPAGKVSSVTIGAVKDSAASGGTFYCRVADSCTATNTTGWATL